MSAGCGFAVGFCWVSEEFTLLRGGDLQLTPLGEAQRASWVLTAGGRGGGKATWCGAGARPQPPLLATAGLARSSQETTGKCTSCCWDRNVTVRASLLARGQVSLQGVTAQFLLWGRNTKEKKKAEIMINIFLS